MTEAKMNANILIFQEWKQLELSYFTRGSIILCKCFKNTAGQYLLKLNTRWLYKPQILLQGLHLRDVSANVHHGLWTGIFILDFTYKLQARVNQNVCQNKMNKCVHIMVWAHSVHTMEYYTAIKENELLLNNKSSELIHNVEKWNQAPASMWLHSYEV